MTQVQGMVMGGIGGIGGGLQGFEPFAHGMAQAVRREEPANIHSRLVSLIDTLEAEIVSLEDLATQIHGPEPVTLRNQHISGTATSAPQPSHPESIVAKVQMIQGLVERVVSARQRIQGGL